MIYSCDPDLMPGFVTSPRREYLYIQTPDPAAFSREFSTIGDLFLGVPPSSGGLINEEALIVVDSRPQIDLCGVSFRGDIKAWENVIVDHCSRGSRIYGIIDPSGVHLSDGRFIPWSDCSCYSDRPT